MCLQHGSPRAWWHVQGIEHDLRRTPGLDRHARGEHENVACMICVMFAKTSGEVQTGCTPKAARAQRVVPNFHLAIPIRDNAINTQRLI